MTTNLYLYFIYLLIKHQLLLTGISVTNIDSNEITHKLYLNPLNSIKAESTLNSDIIILIINLIL